MCAHSKLAVSAATRYGGFHRGDCGGKVLLSVLEVNMFRRWTTCPRELLRDAAGARIGRQRSDSAPNDTRNCTEKSLRLEPSPFGRIRLSFRRRSLAATAINSATNRGNSTGHAAFERHVSGPKLAASGWRQMRGMRLVGAKRQCRTTRHSPHHSGENCG